MRLIGVVVLLSLFSAFGCNRLGGGAAGAANNIYEAPPGSSPPPANGKKRVFVTSTTYTGFLGGLTAADNICQARANAAALGGTWVAWLSDGTVNAINHINDVSPWYLIDAATVVFPTKASVASPGPAVPINLTELNNAPPVTNVWTGTAATGNSSANNCQSWTTSSNRVTGDIGTVGTGASWTQNNFLTCSLAAALYCFEQ